MNFADYLAIDAVNWSSLKNMAKSPLHYKYWRENDRPDTAAMAVGRACHTAVFEPMRFLRDYALFEGARRQGKAWDAFEALHAHQTILKVEEYERALAVAASVRAHPVAAQLLAKCAFEVPIQWVDEATGIRCKGRLDGISESLPACVDLKTSGDITERRFMANAARMAYHCQFAMYSDGHFAVAKKYVPFYVIAVEQKPPHDVGVFRVADDDLYAGQETYRELLRGVKYCQETNNWPGQYPGEITPRFPTWIFNDTEDDLDGLTFAESA